MALKAKWNKVSSDIVVLQESDCKCNPTGGPSTPKDRLLVSLCLATSIKFSDTNSAVPLRLTMA